MSKKTIIIICLLLFCAAGIYAKEDPKTSSITKMYYSGNLSESVFRFGIVGRIGQSYYMNYNPENTFTKYTIGFRLFQERAAGIAPVFRIESYFESEEFTNEKDYYSTRFRWSSCGLIGLNYKIPSGLSFFENYYPYLLAGFGRTMVSFQNIMQKGNYVYSDEISADGSSFLTSLGSEFEMIRSLVYLDINIMYIYTFGLEDSDNDEEGSGNENSSSQDSMKEYEFVYSIGIVLNLF